MDDSESPAGAGAGDDATAERAPGSDDDGAPDRGAEDPADDGHEELTDDEGVPDGAFGDPDAIDEELPGPPLGESRTLNPRVQLLWSVQVVVLAALVGGLAWVGIRFDLLPTWVVPAVVGVALVGGGLLVRARFRRWSYEVREDALYLDRGVVTQVRTVVPLVRVQHTDTARGPVERALGLANTVVYTAGSRGADVTVPGLTHDDADELQRLLKRLAVDSAAEDAV